MTTEREVPVGQVLETLTYDAYDLRGHIQDVINFLENTQQKIHARGGADIMLMILDHGEDAAPEVEFTYLRAETEHETRIREHQEQTGQQESQLARENEIHQLRQRLAELESQGEQ